jgi:hypothetical protein
VVKSFQKKKRRLTKVRTGEGNERLLFGSHTDVLNNVLGHTHLCFIPQDQSQSVCGPAEIHGFDSSPSSALYSLCDLGII